jgi:hypothetical protein
MCINWQTYQLLVLLCSIKLSTVPIKIIFPIENWTAEDRSPTGAEDFSSKLCVQTSSGAHSASYTMGTGGSFPEGKVRPGRDADHSHLSSAEVKKE